MRVFLGSDHAGFALKAELVADLARLGHEPVDCGPHELDPDDDYPPYCLRAAARAVAEPGSLAIVVGGSGNGEAISANKVKGARCVLAHSDDTARLGRAHNDANVLALGARTIPNADAIRFASIFVATPFSGEERHVRRIAELAEYERTGVLPEV
jgi:ribose 5-phosphate isomerase B